YFVQLTRTNCFVLEIEIARRERAVRDAVMDRFWKIVLITCKCVSLFCVVGDLLSSSFELFTFSYFSNLTSSKLLRTLRSSLSQFLFGGENHQKVRFFGRVFVRFAYLSF